MYICVYCVGNTLAGQAFCVPTSFDNIISTVCVHIKFHTCDEILKDEKQYDIYFKITMVVTFVVHASGSYGKQAGVIVFKIFN